MRGPRREGGISGVRDSYLHSTARLASEGAADIPAVGEDRLAAAGPARARGGAAGRMRRTEVFPVARRLGRQTLERMPSMSWTRRAGRHSRCATCRSWCICRSSYLRTHCSESAKDHVSDNSGCLVGRDIASLPFSSCSSDRQLMFSALVRPAAAAAEPPAGRWARRTDTAPGICFDNTRGGTVLHRAPARAAGPGSIAAHDTASARHMADGHHIVGGRQPSGLEVMGIDHQRVAGTHSGSWETRMTSFAGRGVVSRPGGILSPRTFAPAGSPGVGMTSTARSWWADVVGMAAFGRRRRLGVGGSATLRGSLSVDTLCLHDGRLPCYDNRKHGPERAGLERERGLRGGVDAKCECVRDGVFAMSRATVGRGGGRES